MESGGRLAVEISKSESRFKMLLFIPGQNTLMGGSFCNWLILKLAHKTLGPLLCPGSFNVFFQVRPQLHGRLSFYHAAIFAASYIIFWTSVKTVKLKTSRDISTKLNYGDFVFCYASDFTRFSAKAPSSVPCLRKGLWHTTGRYTEIFT